MSLGQLSGELAFSCTCPIGAEGSACKHVVAAGLAWLDHDHPRPPTDADLREHLRGRTREQLVDLIMERAADDEWLHGRLILEASGGRGAGPDLRTMMVALDAVIEPRGFVPYREAYDYFHTVDIAIDEIEGLLGDPP